MRNEYNMKLDGNGYAKSILQEGSCCHLCGRNGSMDKLDRHDSAALTGRKASAMGYGFCYAMTAVT